MFIKNIAGKMNNHHMTYLEQDFLNKHKHSSAACSSHSDRPPLMCLGVNQKSQTVALVNQTLSYCWDIFC